MMPTLSVGVKAGIVSKSSVSGQRDIVCCNTTLFEEIQGFGGKCRPCLQDGIISQAI
jgi:hypothetical protein